MNASSSIRRSPVHDCLEELNPVWAEIHNMKVPLRFKDAAGETQAENRTLALRPELPAQGERERTRIPGLAGTGRDSGARKCLWLPITGRRWPGDSDGPSGSLSRRWS